MIKNYGMFCPGSVYGRWGRKRIRDRGRRYEAKAGECEVLSDNVAELTSSQRVII